MATRPIFVPTNDIKELFKEVYIDLNITTASQSHKNLIY